MAQKISIQSRPIIEIVAGPNGSGKSTFAESYLVRTRKSTTYLNPDLIASGLSPIGVEQASFQAGRILIQEVRDRVGGHNIPSETVKRRHPRCFENFWNLYRPLCDDWHVFDNSNREPKELCSLENFNKLSPKNQSSFIALFLKGKVKS
jgi:predicted ABC-type ATPase